MADISFADLVEIYRHTRFDGNGGGVLTIANDGIAGTLQAIEAEQDFYDTTQISLVAPGDQVVGSDVHINIAAPKLSLGVLADNFEALFRSPGAAFVEPTNYYVIQDEYASGDEPIPDTLSRYRALLSVVAILREAASYVVDVQREMIFIGTEKVVMPLIFDEADLKLSLTDNAARLARVFNDPLHGDEKASLLAAVIIEFVSGQRREQRFSYLIANLDRICDEVEKGYRLFVSSFSYSKIRKEIEAARLDYVNKIHKTIVDIQGQLLGIPVATIVVTSQLKRSNGCDIAFWTNTAVLLGAWIFVVLLCLAVRNQWHTLTMLDGEIEGQKNWLTSDHAAVRDDFIDVFEDLKKRVRSHRTVLIVVGLLGFIGAILATFAFLMLTERGSAICLISP